MELYQKIMEKIDNETNNQTEISECMNNLEQIIKIYYY